MNVPKERAEAHYADLSSKPFFASLVEYICSGPVVAIALEGKDVVAQGRKLLGATNPLQADPGSIRGTYCIDIGRNICHGAPRRHIRCPAKTKQRSMCAPMLTLSPHPTPTLQAVTPSRTRRRSS
jgi:hypothetical protein